MRKSLLILLAASAAIATAQAPTLAERTNAQAQRTERVANELVEMIRQGEDNPATIISVGTRFADECDRAAQIAREYRDFDTRFGLQSELDDFSLMVSAIQKGKGALGQLVGITGPAAYTPEQMTTTYNMFEEDMLPTLKMMVDMEFEAQGVGDFLTDPGLDTAKDAITRTLEQRLREDLENEIKNVVGVRISVGHSLRSHLKMAARHWLGTKIRGLVFRVAANALVVELLGNKILDWIGPQVREYFRHKGSLETRTERALEIMRDRAQAMHRLESESDMENVRFQVESALRHIDQGNKYLREDLRTSERRDLYDQFVEGETHLLDAIKLTRTRFLMNSELAKTNFDDLVVVLDGFAKDVRTNLNAYANKQGAETSANGTMKIYKGGENALYNRKYWGSYTAHVTPAGDGYQVRVIGPDGDVIENINVMPDAEHSKQSLQAFSAQNPSWPDGEAALFVLTRVLKRNSNDADTVTLMWFNAQGSRLFGVACRIQE